MFIQPMIVKEADKLPTSADWCYQVKKDGGRCISDGPILRGRSGNMWTHKFPEITAELRYFLTKWPDLVLDGEIASPDDLFSKFQNRVHLERNFQCKIAAQENPMIFFVFDVLCVESNRLLINNSLKDRTRILGQLFETACFAGESIQMLPYYEFGDILLHRTQLNGEEGVVAKRYDGLYHPGKEGDWVKVKNYLEGEFEIYGATSSDNPMRPFGALILGQEGRHVGSVGSGFNYDELAETWKILNQNKSDVLALPNVIEEKPIIIFTHPIKCEVRYLSLAPDGKLRQPTWRRFI